MSRAHAPAAPAGDGDGWARDVVASRRARSGRRARRHPARGGRQHRGPLQRRDRRLLRAAPRGPAREHRLRHAPDRAGRDRALRLRSGPRPGAGGLPGRVQALALAWTTPFRGDCLSVTTAFAFGFDPAFWAEGCRRTRPSPYFDSPSTTPFRDWGMRPAMLLAGASVAEAKAMIDRGVAADSSFPSGTAYLLSISDRARNMRAARYGLATALDVPVRVRRIDAD